MITIALDESGKFENIEDTKNVATFIGGVLFDDFGDKQETIRERERIEQYYKNVIGSVSDGSEDFAYPKSLHSIGNPYLDSNVVKPVKSKVKATIGEFLKSGTFNGQPVLAGKSRKGKYYVFAFLKSDQGMKDLIGNNVSFMLRDDYASNLYFHMATQTVSRLIFHNPVIHNISEVAFNIATRRSEDLDKHSERALEYKRQGFKPESATASDQDVFFRIANSDIYRTVISQEMLRAEMTNISVDSFDVKPILYHRSSGMEFLYLADSICSYLSYHLKGKSDGGWLSGIISKVNNIIGTDSALVFAYDEIDRLFERALSAYERGDVYEALSFAYCASRKESIFAGYYNNKWFKTLIKAISTGCSEAEFTLAVRKLHSSITTNTLDQDELIYILSALEIISHRMEKILDDDESRGVLYELYDTGVSAYCHIGNSNGAIAFFNRCRKFAYRVGVEDYLRTLNRVVETLLDNFEWDKARQVADDSIKYQSALLNMKNELPVYRKHNQMYSLGLSKALSQQAQVYAFYRDQKCEEVFREALSSFPRDSADYKITQSYLMHYYLDINNKERYESEATDYFGNQTSPEKRLDYILKEAFEDSPIINYKYALYVYIRGFYMFEHSKASVRLLERIYSIDETLKKAEEKEKGKKESKFTELSGHPAEIIFKYIAMVAYDHGDYERASEMIGHAENRLKYKGATIKLITAFGEVEYYDHIGDVNNRNKKLDKCVKLVNGQFPQLATELKNKGYDQKYSILSKWLVYMYH